MDVNIMVYSYEGTVCSDLDTIRNFIDKTLINLSNFIKDKNIMFDIRLILNELIVNGAYHGNDFQMSKCVCLKIEMMDEKLIIEVQDEGDGIDYSIDEYDPLDFKSCGRGLVLVNGLSDEFIVEKNRVISVKNLN